MTDDSQRLQRIVLHTQRGNDVSPLSEMQAAVLRPQLDSLDARNQVRSQAASAFTESVQQTGSRIRAVSDAPRLNDGGNSPVYYKLAMELDPSVATNRSTIAAAALEQGLLFDTAFPALHRIHGRNRFRAAGDLPNATRFHESLMVLHHTLLTSTRMTAVELGGQIAAICNGEFKVTPRRHGE